MTVEVAAAYLDRQLARHDGSRPLVLGISGPQGSGKTYLAANLLRHIEKRYPTLSAVGVSIDDFYLTHEEQAKVSRAAAASGNFVLEGRGLPGTHDLPLAWDTLQRLCSRTVPTKIPVYDKSAFHGEGDRSPESEWQVVERPPDVVILEGWFVGFRSLGPAVFPVAYLTSDPAGVVQASSLHHLEAVDHSLAAYERLWALLDHFVFLDTDDLDNVYRWRHEQEADLVARRGRGMSASEVAAFVRRYMPMYHLYYRRMCGEGVAQTMGIQIDSARAVTGVRTFR